MFPRDIEVSLPNQLIKLVFLALLHNLRKVFDLVFRRLFTPWLHHVSKHHPLIDIQPEQSDLFSWVISLPCGVTNLLQVFRFVPGFLGHFASGVDSFDFTEMAPRF